MVFDPVSKNINLCSERFSCNPRRPGQLKALLSGIHLRKVQRGRLNAGFCQPGLELLVDLALKGSPDLINVGLECVDSQLGGSGLVLHGEIVFSSLLHQEEL